MKNSIIPDLFLGLLIPSENKEKIEYTPESIYYVEDIKEYYDKSLSHILVRFPPYKDAIKICVSDNYDIHIKKTSLLSDLGLNSDSTEKEVLEKIFRPMLDKFVKTIKRSTLQDLNWEIADWDDNLQELQYLYRYHLCKIDCILKFGTVKLKFNILIPLKLFRNILYIFTEEDIFKYKIEEVETIITGGFEQIWIQKKLFFPFKLKSFLESLSNLEFQRLLNLLITRNMITDDMLGGLAKVLQDGYNRITNSLSKNLRKDFSDNWLDKSNGFDARWIEVATYQTTINIKKLIEEGEYESESVKKFKEIFQQGYIILMNEIFDRKPLYMWLEEIISGRKLFELFSKMDNLTLAKMLIAESEDTLHLIRKNTSRRKFSMIREDIEYARKITSIYESLKTKLDFIYLLCEDEFNDIPRDEKKLKLWLSRFQSVREYNFAANIIGPTDFVIALHDVDEKWRRVAVRNLNRPMKFFVDDLLRSRIRLNFTFGEQSIKEAVTTSLLTFYQLHRTGQIDLKPIEADNKQESI